MNEAPPPGRELRDRHDLHVYYEDTDFSGFVYHANYIKFFERAREHLIGIAMLRRLVDEGVHFVVSHLEFDYHRPAGHGDQLALLSVARYSRSPRIAFQHEAWLLEGGVPAKKLVSGIVHIVALGRDQRPVRLPDSIFDHLNFRSSELGS